MGESVDVGTMTARRHVGWTVKLEAGTQDSNGSNASRILIWLVVWPKTCQICNHAKKMGNKKHAQRQPATKESERYGQSLSQDACLANKKTDCLG